MLGWGINIRGGGSMAFWIILGRAGEGPRSKGAERSWWVALWDA